MESRRVIEALGALAQETRLGVFRLLVQAGPEGLAAGEIAARLDVPAPTLSFHLRSLAHADLVSSRREGRSLFYSANYGHFEDLLGFLTDKCCTGGAARSTPRAAAAARR
jgi:DNA-binding transcriptional ArsR family regulator